MLAGPYHRDNGGPRATIELFSASDDAEIRSRLRALKIGWVVTCPGPEDRAVFKTADRNGLAERLAAGRVPDYLEEIADPAQPDMRFYRVRTDE